MGIDIYARWAKQSEEEKKAQYTGFSVTSGDVGYLREAYHGGPYATRLLMPEAFDDTKCVEVGEDFGALIPAATLRERLPAVLEAVRERNVKLYQSTEEDLAPVLKAFTDFVELCERKEKELGGPCLIIASY